jgi:hypothetical protein
MNNKFRTPFVWAIALISASLLAAGCTGYRVGSMLPGDVKTVHVPTFINRTSEPLLEIDTTQAAISALQRDGSLRVVRSINDADAFLEVVLTEYRIEPVSFRKDVRTAAQQYRAFITASMVMRRTSDQSVVVEAARIEGRYVFDVIGDLTSSKLQANPQAAADLANTLVQRMVEYWP